VKLHDWANLAQIGVLLFAIPSTFVLFVQLADIRRTLRAETFEATAKRLGQITRLGLDYPQAYAQLFETREKYNTDSLLVAEGILDAIDTELLRRRALPDGLRRRLPALDPYFTDLFRELPGLQRVLELRLAWYSNEIRTLSGVAR